MVLGLAPSTLHLQLNGLRPMPAEVAAAIRRALPEIQDRE
jgi:DNA-binding transcriptional regulator YdaS (Cro superfamily)